MVNENMMCTMATLKQSPHMTSEVCCDLRMSIKPEKELVGNAG